MGKLDNVSNALAGLAEDLPVQRSPKEIKREARTKPKAKKVVVVTEPVSQFTLKMRESLHNELKKLAVNNDMTIRGFIMEALKARGLAVTEQDMADGRRRD